MEGGSEQGGGIRSSNYGKCISATHLPHNSHRRQHYAVFLILEERRQ